MVFARCVLASIFIACCLTRLTLGATPETPPDEVGALRSIAETLGKTDWKFSDTDPCRIYESTKYGDPEEFPDDVTWINCTTSNDNTTYHVVGIFLKRQSLSGTLPELDGLPYLDHIDLTLNYLSGPIPPTWGSTKLTQIDLLGNRLTGSIPVELANLSNLTSLVIEQNNLSGTLPPALGNLTKIERLLINSNKFTGELPQSFARLTALKEFRISDNNFRGPIPDFIQNWKELDKLHIQASGLSGPIPSDIGALESVTELRISDLDGPENTFPSLDKSTKLKQLILRSCNLTGRLPDYLRGLQNLKQLDVSFNRLSGQIQQDNLSVLGTRLNNLYLTGNQFTGRVPRWILEAKDNADVSINNFTGTTIRNCQQENVNFFDSTSRNSGIVSCSSEFSQCEQTWYSLHINCGGPKKTVNDTTFEADENIVGPARYGKGVSNWVLSTTGHFLGNAKDDSYTVQNDTQLSISDPDPVYLTARRSAISLTYYAFCLDNRTYRVELHFAEIQFTNGQNYSSLGRRIFDVYIQGKRKLKDFNIEDEAGEAGKPLVKNFTEQVTDGTLEIHLRWAGKGTTSIPKRGVYGPLISAISVFDPGYKAPSEGGGVSAAVVVAIVTGAAFASLLILGILWWIGCLRRKSTLERDLKGIELHTSSFTLREIKAATNNFDDANKIGEGGFGPVFKGTLGDGTVIAVKQLSAKSRQGNREFVTEIGMISALQHPHLVKLYGCCIEGNQLLLIYEYLENNSLYRALFGSEECQIQLDWPTRRKICIGIARGLAYLHEESRLKVVHRDIKSTNVLLDKNLNPKISDFGLAKLHEEDDTHISTRIAGTYGYMAPEYAMHGHLSDKADVYSFGIVALEIVSGRCNTRKPSKEESFYLLDWAHILKEKGQLLDLIDPRIGSNCNIEEVTAMINVALLCTNPTAAARPSMSSVVSMLEGRADVEEFVRNSSISANEEAMRKFYRQLEENDGGNSETKSMLADGPWTSSSTSAADLYPVNLTSGYLQNRDSTN